MKYNSFLKILTFAFVCAILATSCVKEGPMGLPGEDGKDGENGTNGTNGINGDVTCLVCHSVDKLDCQRRYSSECQTREQEALRCRPSDMCKMSLNRRL